MITLKEFIETIEYRITEGFTYGWACYGTDAHCLDSYGDDMGGYTVSVVFDRRDQTVFEMTACDYDKQRAYRWINPAYAKAARDDAGIRGVSFKEAWDDVNYTDLDVGEDMLNKARAIIQQEEYDTRVQVPIDLDRDELFKLMTMAHERDITFNQLIVEILEVSIAHQAVDISDEV